MSGDVFVFPMSSAQERLFTLDRLDEKSAAYHLSAAVRLRGRLDASLVARCVEALIDRHEALRTTFALVDGSPSQIVHERSIAPLARVDLRALSPGDRERELHRRIARDTRTPFDLEEGPLLRVTLVRVAEEEHLLLWVVHHIVFDGWSTGLVLEEFAELYEALSNNRDPGLPELALQYADFAAWQRSRLATSAIAEGIEYWRATLRADGPPFELPTDRPRPPTRRLRGRRHTFSLAPELATRARAFASTHGTTLFSVLFAAFQALLARTAGANDLAIGMPITNRTRKELERVVGCFANTVVLRANLHGDETFDELVTRANATVRETQAHADVPFEKVVEAIRPARDPSRSPLFQVLFALEPERGKGPSIAGLDVAVLDLDAGGSQLDLALEIAPLDEGFAAAIEYDTDLFDEDTIAAFARRYEHVLSTALDAPATRLVRLAIVDETDRDAQLRFGGVMAVAPAPALSVERAFASSAATRPDAIAIVDGARSSTYALVEGRANALARRLGAAGIGPERKVGLCLPRSTEAIVAMLATLKIGGAYVPIDPTYPKERIRDTLVDSGATLLLAGRELVAQLGPDVPAIALDAEVSETAALDADAASSPIPADAAAYLLYTSGSTGTPKGVVVPRGALASFVANAVVDYDITASDRVLQFASLSFDASVEEIFPCLAVGGTLVLRTDAMLESVETFFAACAELGVTILDLPTSYFHRIAVEVARGVRVPDSVRLVIVGGEAALPERVAAFRAAVPDNVRLVNTYGPTEATVVATSEPVDSADLAGRVAIGRPLSGVRAYVLDAWAELVPIGSVGELYLAGTALTRGYHARPEVTAERYLPDPFSAEPSARMYRTGDRVRWRRDGRLDYVGRADAQLKIRGFRIEPGEIEARLAEEPGVRTAVVVARTDQPGDARLVAYVDGAEGVDPEALRRALTRTLPGYMVPSAFVVIDGLPRTTSGKIDRRALPPPPEAASDDAILPTSPIERALARIWSELLGRPTLGVNENFFALGGDSILALQVVARCRAAGISLAPRDLFQHQTIAELAEVARRPGHAAVASEVLEGDVPLTPIQRWFFERTGPNPHHFNQSVLVEARTPLATADFERALHAASARHDVFRLRFVDDGKRIVQRFADAPAVEVETVDLAGVPLADHDAHITAAATRAQASLHLARGPLLRGICFDRGSEPTRLFLVAHHLVVDAVSWRILLDELETETRSAPEPFIPTTAFATWARRLPPDASAASVTPLEDGSEGDTRVQTAWLDEPATSALVDAAASARVRLDAWLLSALAAAHDRDLVVEVEEHGRDAIPELDVSRTVGWFTRLRSVHLGPADQPSKVAEALSRAPLPLDQAPELSFNYLGRLDASDTATRFALLATDVGADRDPNVPRRYPVELDVAIVGGRLRITWSSGRARESSIGELARRFTAALRSAVTRAPVVRPTFPLAKLDDQALERVLAQAPDADDVYPLTPLQQGMLFHSLWEASQGVYVEQVTCTIDGALDVEAFRRAWSITVAQHDALRTTFLWQGVERPLQIVHRDAATELEFRDLRALAEDERRGHIEATLAEDRARGFDLVSGPLARLALLRVADTSHVVLFSHHHAILDGWSAGLVMRDIFEAYGAAHPTPRPRASYRDHVAHLEARDPKGDESFFRRRLEGFASATPLPFERTSPPGLDDGYGVHTIELSPRATDRLERLAGELRVTTSAIVQAAWALVLARTSGTEDVVFGLTLAGRSSPIANVETAVGLFINTVPLRVVAPPARPVRAFLAEVFATTADSIAHEHVALARVRALAAVPAGRPLFESLLVFENYPLDARLREGFAGLAIRDVSYDDRTNYPLTLTAMPGERLVLRVSYDRRRFEDRAAPRLLATVREAIRELVAHPDAPLGELSLTSPADRRRILETWNATEREYPGDRLVHELIANRAAETPRNVAVIFDATRISYAELDARANQLAHVLVAEGVGPDVLVAVALERSVEMVVALVAVLKAGGAYVPIDPEYPADRVAFMLADAGAPVLVTTWPIASALPSHDARVLCLDVDRGRIAAAPMLDPRVRVSPDALAYTIYTSGSTGRPKGAGNSHRGLRNRLLWMQGEYGLGARDRVLQKTPFSFDVSVWEFFWPLMTGAVLVVASPGDHRDPERLVELIATHEVTTLHFVPPMLQAFLETPSLGACRSLARVICSGEALPAELERRFFERLSGVELHNLYGPTEASIDVTAWRCTERVGATSVPIGVPIANTQIYVLDRAGQPTPIGVPGELHIGGVGLARGYHQRPDLTADRFVPDPFGSVPGARLYRTGDLARHRDDGSVEYVGRLDHQVKIRGLRVELGEIEARLLAHAAVREAVVVARTEPHGGKRLVAYLAGDAGDAALTSDALREWTAVTLPAHMVPTTVVVLDALPLSPNGKVDRKALPSPDEASGGQRTYVAPRNEAERILAEIWGDVLRRERVGAFDDFFELGGDSIVTLQILARAADRGLHLTPKILFEHPTVAGAAALAEHVNEVAPKVADEETRIDAPNAGLSDEEWNDLLDELER